MNPRGSTPPSADPLPIAVRGHTVPRAGKNRRQPSPRRQATVASGAVLVFDTETTTDEKQALLFGCWRYFRPTSNGGLLLVDEGLFYADELPEEDPEGLDLLRRHAATAPTTATSGRLRLLSRDEFVTQVFYPAAYDARATVVGFNLPFDIARLAIDAAEGRGRNLRGFSFTLARGNEAKGYKEQKHKPRVTVKHLNSHTAFIRFSSAYQATQRWTGEFVDCRTLLFALTSKGYGLDSGCRAMGLDGKADPGQHGIITPDYVDYCRVDVERTAQLYQACVRELDALDLPITPAKAYSPASLAKAVLDRLGVTPHSQRARPLRPEVLGYFMSAFYGGRAECRIRHTDVPVSLVDFTSMYPTLFALMGLWPYCIAEELDTRDTTDEVRALLATVTVEALFDRSTWPQLVGVALVQPEADILPVRAPYDEHRDALNIGVNYLTSATPLWYTLPDLVASTLLTGKAPKVLRALRLTHSGRLSGLTPWVMPGGHLLDPAREAPWPAMIEHRQRTRRDQSLAPELRDRIGLFLKITANAGGYGIYAEYNRQDQPKGARVQVDVYSHAEPFATSVAAPEEPGRFSCPPLAAVITGGARLMLALLERCVTDVGGSWAFADTDSMAIVATPDGGLVPCPGGLERDPHGEECIRALRAQQVGDIRDRFAALNPYDPSAVPGSALKHELDARCFAVAAKRYALYRYDTAGTPRLVPGAEHQPCSHGLGHLLNPTDPDSEDRDWIVAWWELYLGAHLTGRPRADPSWMRRGALGKVAITSPATWNALRHHNAGRAYRDQIKSFGFLLHAPGAGDGDRIGRLVAPYTADARRWTRLRWTDLRAPDDVVRISTDPTKPRSVTVGTYRAVANTYFVHSEVKSNGPSGSTCTRTTSGLLRRRHVIESRVSIIGKEANDLDERTSGLRAPRDEHVSVTAYVHDVNGFDSDTLARLQRVGAAEIAHRSGLSARRIRDLLSGKAQPRKSTKAALLAALTAECAL